MPEQSPSNQSREWEERLAAEKGEETPEVGEARDFALKGNDTSAYVGVDPEYQNYANETERPYFSQEGAESVLQERIVNSMNAINNPDLGSDESEEKAEGNGDGSTDTQAGQSSENKTDNGTGSQETASTTDATADGGTTEGNTTTVDDTKAKRTPK